MLRNRNFCSKCTFFLFGVFVGFGAPAICLWAFGVFGASHGQVEEPIMILVANRELYPSIPISAITSTFAN